MRKKLICFVLAAAIIMTWVPVISAEDSLFNFPEPVANPLPVPVPGQLLDNRTELPDPEGTDFIAELSAPMPAIRADGFLAEPTAPLKTLPAEGNLLEKVSEPDPNAISISDAAGLQAMTSGGSYVLTKDIDLSGVEWTPLKRAVTLDGQGHTISGLTLSAGDYVGLFGSVSSGQLTVRNLILKDFSAPDPSGSYSLGALAGTVQAQLTVENVVVDNFQVGGGSASGLYQPAIGGLIGRTGANKDLTISSCSVTGNVSGAAAPDGSAPFTPSLAGGLVGRLFAANVYLTDCITDFDFDIVLPDTNRYGAAGLTANLEAYQDVSILRCVSHSDIIGTGEYAVELAGLVTELKASNGSVCITDSLFDGTLSTGLGGLVGLINTPTSFFQNCRFEGTVSELTRPDPTETEQAFGGIFGRLDRRSAQSIRLENCLNTANLYLDTAAEYPFRHFHVGGLVGMAPDGLSLTGCLNTGDLGVAEEISRCRIGGLVGVFREEGTVTFTHCENRGDITSIGGAGGLISESSKELGVLTFTDCRNTGSISVSSDAYATTSRYSGHNEAGGLVGSANCKLYNCINTGHITGLTAGGLVGDHASSNDRGDCYFQDCRGLGTITTTKYAGGLLGAGDTVTTFVNCAAAPIIEGSGSSAGGLVGNTDGINIRRCAVVLDLSDVAYGSRGGLAGSISGYTSRSICDAYTELTCKDTTAKSSQSGEGYAGGLVGYASNPTGISLSVDNCAAQVDFSPAYGYKSYAYGGLFGKATLDTTITNSYAYGTIRMDTNALSATDCFVGGLVGDGGGSIGQCWGGVDVYGSASSGALVGNGSDHLTVYSCWSDATVSGSSRYSGGLFGCCSSAAIQDCCFLGDLHSSTGTVAGGIAGKIDWDSGHSNLINNCYTSGSVISSSSGGGIVGYLGSGIVRACRFNGTVSSANAGGIVGFISDSDASVYACQASGEVYGQYAGGIAGVTASGSASISDTNGSCFYDCTTNSTVGPCRNCTTNHKHCLGGLLGKSGKNTLISNCHAKNQVTLNILDSISSDQAVGGLSGTFHGTMVDCSAVGVSVNLRGPRNVFAGGLAGDCSTYLNYGGGSLYENCRVTGDVFVNVQGTQAGVTFQAENLYVGGLFGGDIFGSEYNWNKHYANGCVMEGDVYAYRILSPNEETEDGYVEGTAYVGGLGGRAYKISVDACRFDGVRLAPFVHVRTDHVLLGAEWPVEAEVPEVVIPATPHENYTFVVKAVDWSGRGEAYLKEGAKVFVEGVYVGTSDENGEVKIYSNQVKTGKMANVSVSMDGYKDGRRFVYLADGGSTLLVLSQMKPGHIYIEAANYLEEGSSVDLLSYLNNVRVLEFDDGFKKVFFDVEWNDIDVEIRNLYLADENGNFITSVEDGKTDYVQFSELFEPETPIYLIASGFYKGEYVETKQLLSIEVDKFRPHLPMGVINKHVSDGTDDENDGPYFLQGLEWAMGVDDVGPFAGDISLKNGYLELMFNAAGDLDYEIPMWKAAGSADGQVSFGIEGTASIPYTDTYTGEWDAELYLTVNEPTSIDLVPEKDKNEAASLKYSYSSEDKGVFNLKYNFPVPVPFPPYTVSCFFDTILDVGGTAGVHLTGPYNKVDVVEGKLDVSGYGSIFAGVGGEVEDTVALKFGGEGEINPKATLTYSANGDNLDVEMSGQLSAKALVKFLEHKIEGKLRLGGYTWDGEKITWYTLGSEDDGYGGNGAGGGGGGGSHSIQLLDSSQEWQPISRAYLAKGGGFSTRDISALDFSSTEDGPRYENIGEVSEAVLTMEGDTPALYFTADDGSGGTTGSVGSHTLLWRSVMQDIGSWSEPTALTTAEDGFPAGLHADGPYAVWEQSADTVSEDSVALLASTDIMVAVDGKDVHTFEAEGYDYAPKVSASSDGSTALACWLHDPSLTNETAEQGAIELWYSTYDATNGWSVPAQVKTAAAPVSFFPDKSSGYIYYRTADGTLYEQAPSSSSKSTHLSDLSGRTVVCSGITASFAEDGTLTIRKSNSSLPVTRSTNYISGQNVAMVCSDSTYYLFWPEAEGIRMMRGTSSNVWEAPILLMATDELPEQLSAAVVDGVPHVSWYQRTALEDGQHQLDLHTACADPNEVDLVLQRVEFNRDDLLETGVLTIQGEAYNNGMADAQSITVTVLDGETQVYSHTFDKIVSSGGTARFYASLAPSTTATTYTVKITPDVTDADPTDNDLTLPYHDVSAKIMDASFLDDGSGGVELQAMVRNDGLLPLTNLKVEVTDPSGSVLNSKSYGNMENVPVSSYRQVVLADAQPDTYYTVTVSSGDTVLDTTMLRYDDPNAVTLAVTQVEAKASGQVSVSLVGQNHKTAAPQLLLALYQNDQMIVCGLANVDALNGKQTVSFQMGELEQGSYDYKLFFLSDDEAFSPYITEKTGVVQISES